MQPSAAILTAATSLGACFLLWVSYPATSFSSSASLTASLYDAASNSLSWTSTSTFKTLEKDADFQLSTYNQSFPDFLSTYPQNDLIWLTLADKFFSETCTTHLQQFVKSLPPYQSPLRNEDGTTQAPRDHRIVTLCIDPGCMQTCATRNWTCYGEYELSRPEIIFPSTWPKLAGLIDIMESGRDAIFVDSDVFFRSDPFEHMAPLGEYDWQIQDEAIEGNVNTGFFHIMPTGTTIAHWKGVLAMDMQQVSRDQHNTNTLLGTEKIRPIPDVEEGPAFKAQFESENGISMNVIPTETVYSYHLAFSWPRLHSSDASAWHGTCLDNPPLKYLLPREKGFWQDIDSYYSIPPPLLQLPALSGTEEELLEQMRQYATLAVQTNRSMVPPSIVTVKLSNGETVLRDFFSVFPVDQLVFDKSLPLLESQYVQHALPYHVENPEMTASLLAENNINMAAYGGIEQVADALLTTEWRYRFSVTLSNWQSGRLGGTTLDSLSDVRTCSQLHKEPGCAQICRTA